MNKEIAEVVNNEWVSKRDVAKSLGVDEKTIQTIVNEVLSLETGFQTQNHIKKGGYHNSVVYYDTELINMIGLQLKKNAMSQGKQSEVIKQDNITDVTVGFEKNHGIGLSKQEVRIEVERQKTLQLQSKAQIENSKAQKEIVKQTEMTKREEMRLQKEQARAEILKQKNYDRAIKLKEKGYKEKVEELTSQLENQAIQYEYTKKLKALDAECKYMLYIFKDATKPACYKIGKSTSLGNRLAIGYAENCTLEIAYKRYDTCEYNIDELEKQIHSELNKFRASLYLETGSTEWFFLTKEQLEYIVKKYKFVEV